MKRSTFAVSMAFLIGLILFGLSLLATRTLGGSFNGYPLTITHPTFPCGAPNPFNGCAFVYDPYAMLLDSLFWVTVGFIPATPLSFVFVNQLVRRRTKALVGIAVVAVGALSVFFLVPLQMGIAGSCVFNPSAHESLSFQMLGTGMTSEYGQLFWNWRPPPPCFG